MASARDVERPDAPLSGEAVAKREFAPARRGYDQDEVRRYLGAVGQEIDVIRERAADLERRMAAAESRTAAPDLSEEAVVAAVGAEMAASLRSAHSAATELRKRAADETERLTSELRQRVEREQAEADRRLTEATAEAERMLAEASEAASRERSEAGAEAEERLRLASAEAEKRRTDAEQDAARIGVEVAAEAERIIAEATAGAEQAAAAIKRDATSEAQQIIGKVRADAELLRQQTTRDHDEMIRSAEAQRDRVLADLARRRRVATIQIEQLRAGRERLIESYATVRRTLEEVQDDLNRADAEARAAADEAGRRLEADPDSGADLDPVFAPVDTVAGPGAAPEAPPPTGSGPVVGTAIIITPPPGPPAVSGSERVRVLSVGSERVRGGGSAAAATSLAPSASPMLSAPPVSRREPSAAPRPGAAPGETQAGGHLRVVSGSGAPAGDHDPSDHESDPPAGGAGLELVRNPPDDAPEPEGPGPEEAASEAADASEAVVSAEDVEPDEVVSDEESEEEKVMHKVVRSVPVTPEVTPAAVEPVVIETVADAGKPTAAVETGADAAEPTAETQPTDAVGSLFDRIRHGRKQAVDKAREVLDAAPVPAAPVQAVDEPAVAPPAAEPSVARHHEDPDAGVTHSDADEGRLQQREVALADLERDLNRRLKRTLQDEQNDLLDRLRNVKGAPNLHDLLPAVEAHTEPYVSAAQPILAKAAKAGFALGREWQGETALEADAGAAGPDARTSAEQAQVVAERIVEPLRRRIEQLFADQGDDSFEMLNESLGSVYRATRAQRVERVAADVISSTFAAGTWQATPDGFALRWIAEDADGPCPDCDDNALAGSLVKGEAFPTGQLYPPAHDGCRCLLVPHPE